MFDLIALLILLVSAAVGFIRGAAREVVAVLALILAVFLAIIALRLTVPITLTVIHISWLAKAVALLIGFVAFYILFRVAGGALIRRIHEYRALGTLDRAIGLGFGLIRALLILGVLNLLITAVTPPERMPSWIQDAKLFPLTSVAAKALKVVAPASFSVGGKVGPAIGKAVTGRDDSATDRDSIQDTPGNWGYEAPTRNRQDDPVEKAR